GLGRIAGRPQQYREIEIARGRFPLPATTAAASALPPREHGKPFRLAGARERDAEIRCRVDRLVAAETPGVHPNSAFAAACAAPTNGPGKTKNSVVNSAVAAATKESAGGRASKAGSPG